MVVGLGKTRSPAAGKAFTPPRNGNNTNGDGDDLTLANWSNSPRRRPSLSTTVFLFIYSLQYGFLFNCQCQRGLILWCFCCFPLRECCLYGVMKKAFLLCLFFWRFNIHSLILMLHCLQPKRNKVVQNQRRLTNIRKEHLNSSPNHQVSFCFSFFV